MTELATARLPYDPTVWEVYQDTEAVNEAIESMARNLVLHYAGSAPLFLALLEGGRYFATELEHRMIAVAASVPEIEYLPVSTYGDGYTAGECRVDKDFLHAVLSSHDKDRPVVLLDDVLDSGTTLATTEKFLRTEFGIRAVDSVVLVEKQIERPTYQTATFSCFSAENTAWLAGCGMNDGTSFRDLPYIIRKFQIQAEAA